jgi:hypothetical protein
LKAYVGLDMKKNVRLILKKEDTWQKEWLSAHKVSCDAGSVYICHAAWVLVQKQPVKL